MGDNMFDNLLINGIIMMFPYFVYMFYISTNKRLTEGEKNIVQLLITLLSFLLLFKYGTDSQMILILLNIPLYVTLINKKGFSYLLLVICIISVYQLTILNFWLLILNYLIICLVNKREYNNNTFIQFFFLMNSITYIIIFPSISSITSIVSFLILIIIFNILYKMGNDNIGFNKELIELEKEKQVRMSLFKITHEIKNPIAVCKAYLDMYDVNDKKKSEKYVGIIKNEIDRLLCLLEDFMLVNKSNINPDIMDINMLLEDKINSINTLMNEKKISINYDLPDEEIYIFGDYNRLSQVIINLIKNSIEAESNNISIKCSVKNNKVVINIKDDGIGMNDDIVPKIKEPFYTTKLKGTGLGVSLSNEIIEAHNGTLCYKSEYGKGTSVKIMLPLYEIV